MKKNNCPKIFRMSFNSISFLIISVLFIALQSSNCFAAKEKEINFPKDVTSSIGYLLTLEEGTNSTLDSHKITPLLDYVVTSNATDKIIDIPKREGYNGAGMRMDVKAPLSKILEYTYNPDIPSYALYPSVIRVSGWYKDSQFVKENAKPWELLGKGQTKLWHGKEFEVNTPDSFGGAYYRYDLGRLLVVTNYKGLDVFMSISRQSEDSTVGKKGLVIDDNQWNYFYSGIPGLTSGAIGWMDTYMYGSMSVYVYMQDPNNKEHTINFLFKWLKAGWAGMNVVRPKHIFEGSQRFGRAFSKLMESDSLPEPATLAARLHSIERMDQTQMASYMQEYSKSMESIASKNETLADDFEEVFVDGKYSNTFTHEEKVAILVKEYLKKRMGKQNLIHDMVVEN